MEPGDHVSVYLLVKLLHVLSATILFGTGLGTAFFMLQAYRSGDRHSMRATTRTVVLADWVFTTPAVIVQLATGLWLVHRLGIPYGSLWFIIVLALFGFVGACWLPVVGIQIRLRHLLESGADIDACRPLMRVWVALGVPAFAAVLVLFALMVYRPWTGYLLFGQ
jgi:uncharacterized membrane protein